MDKVVFFDIGGTLLYADPSVPEVFATVARRLGHDVTVRDVEPCMVEVDAYYQEEYLRDGDFWCVHERAVQIWLDMYAMMADYCGIKDDILSRRNGLIAGIIMTAATLISMIAALVGHHFSAGDMIMFAIPALYTISTVLTA